MRRLDSLEERIRTIYQGVRVLQDHVRSSARQIKDIYELVFVAIGSLLVYVIIEGLKSIFGDVVVWLFWTGLVVYFVWRWWRHIVKDPPPMAS